MSITPTATGPRTDEGKARAAQNSLKHGLTGAGKFLPAELAAEVDSRRTEFAHRFQPADAFATFLVGQLALASVRIENCQRLELEMTEHLRNTSSEHHAENDDRLAAYLLYNRIHRDPPTIRLHLIQTPAGRDILVRKICNLIHGLPDGRCNWTDDDLTRALDLLGFSREERHLDPEALAIQGLANLARDPATPLDTRKVAGTKLLEELNKAIKSNDLEAPDPVHAQQKQSLSADGRWFHNHDDLKRLRRYEAAARRLFFKTLALLEAERKNKQTQPESQKPVKAKPQAIETPPLAPTLPASKPRPPIDRQLRALEILDRFPENSTSQLSLTRLISSGSKTLAEAGSPAPGAANYAPRPR